MRSDNGPSGRNWARALVALVGAAAFATGTGCDRAPGAGESKESTEVSRQALSSAATRTLGFESLQDWGPHWSSPTLQLNTLHTEGQSSLSVKGGGWMSVISRQLTKQDLNDPVPSVVGVDVRVPLSPLNPNWFGTVEFFVDVPSAGIWSQPLGSVDLSSSGFVPGQFRRAQVSVPATVQSALSGQFTDLRFRIALNTTSGEPGAYLLDRFTYGPGVCTPQPDGNPCTTDTCVNGQPTWTPLPQGTACDTNTNVCDGSGSCNASASCVLGPPPVLDDGNPCTTDACDPVSGVSHTPKSVGTSCSDGNACNGGEVCNASASCLQGAPPELDDGNPCTADSCDPATGVIHTPVPTGTSCADSTVCNGSETCSSNGACTAGTPLEVPPNTVCTTYSCDPVAGVLATQKPAGASCSNETVCDGQETCNGSGSCQSGTPLVIPPNTACMSYACNPVAGIVATPAPNGTSCADQTVCNGAETCAAGECVAGTPPEVPANTACAAFSCDAVAGIVQQNQPVGTSCADQTVCNGAETCDGAGACAAGTALEVPADTACTTYSCDSVAGVVTTQVPAGTSCANESECDGEELCDGSGACTAGTGPDLDDENPCTVDACDPELGVTHTPVAEGTSCGDGNACNGAETCDTTGACQSGTPVDTDSGNDCTVGQCDPATGIVTFVPVPENTPCFFDTCTDGACSATGTCLAAGDSVPDDGDSCTLEWCDPVLGPQVRSCEAIDRTVGTTLSDSMKWLYTGEDALQQGVPPGTIVAERAAAIRGTVRTREGALLSNVKVIVLGHPELGWTITRADGAFDLVVNGGGDLVVELTKDGYLDVQRQVHARWGEYAHVNDAVMIPPDPIVTPVDLTSSDDFQVAQGSVQTDDDGSRQGTLLIPADTEATMHLADGTTVSLDAMDVRITEFTVGGTGPDAMPGALPPQSHYTYAFEVNADQAVEAGAPEITFSQPLVYYVDNFLGFPAGTAVPLGAYDRTEGAWKAEESGVVLKILSESGGLADIDVTGDDLADTSLEAFGITTAERERLAALYEPGQSLWRVRITHFTQPWDCNWGTSPPDDAAQGGGPPGGPPPCTDRCCGAGASPPGDVAGASVIGCREQLLREEVPIAGTPFSLHYASNRVPGRRVDYRVQIPLSGASVPASLERIDLEVKIAGRRFAGSYPPIPNQSTTFEWDGLDLLGRRLQGSQTANIGISYVYGAVYTQTSTFGYNGNGTPITGDRARGEFYFSRSFSVKLGTYNALDAGFGGWTLSNVHAYEPVARRLQLGTGGRQDETALPPVMKLIAGGGTTGTPVDGGPATNIRLDLCSNCNSRWPVGVDPQGRAYIVSSTGTNTHALWFVNRNGTLTSRGIWNRIDDLSVAPDGAVYIVQATQNRVYKLSPDGSSAVFAGNGTFGVSGDEGPAAAASVGNPQRVSAAPDGSVYIYQAFNLNQDGNWLRRVTPDGKIHTIAGNGCESRAPRPGPGTRALDLCIDLTGGIAAAHDGSVYAYAVHEPFVENRGGNVFAFRPDGTVDIVAGTSCAGISSSSCPTVEGLPPLSTNLPIPFSASIAVDKNGLIYVGDGRRIREISPDDVRTVIGTAGAAGTTIINEIPSTAYSLNTTAFAVGPDGIYVSSNRAGIPVAVYRSSVPLPPDSDAAFLLAARSGDAYFSFDAQGRHLGTHDGLTGAQLFGFTYLGGLLTEVSNVAGLATHVERDAAGAPLAIVGPYGQRTSLEMGPDGYLASITNHEGERVSMTYTSDGLLTSFTNARGHTASMTYDAEGRLQTDTDAAGGSHTLERVGNNQSWSVTRTTALGRTTEYDAEITSAGQLVSTTTNPDGTVHTQNTNRDGVFVASLPDGTQITTRQLPDRRFGMAAPVTSETIVLPSGLSRTVSRSRSYAGLSPTNVLDFTSFTDTAVTNGRTWSSQYVRSARTSTTTTPVGRRIFKTLDALGRAVQLRVDGLTPVEFAYDVEGRPEQVVHGARANTNGYFPTGTAAGFLASVTDAMGETTTFSRDSVGRMLGESRADATTLFEWDANGNLTAVTPPGKPEHTMSYTPVKLLTAYEPPSAGLPLASTTYNYSLDRELLTETRPDGEVITRTYDSAGRLDTVSLPTGTVDYSYYGLTPPSGGAPGKVSAIQGPYGVNLGFGYDGSITTTTSWSGTITGNVSWIYNNDFLPTRQTVTGVTGSSFAVFGYDADLLLTCASPTTCNPSGAGALTVTRNNTNGLITRTDLGNVRETLTYTALGELATQAATYASEPITSFIYNAAGGNRDALGRITQKTEVIANVTRVYRYTYDDLGRLTDVMLNGNAVEHFTYDLNGNRLSAFNAVTGVTSEGDYDGQDRLLGYSDFAYTYTANGELETKTNLVTNEVTLYQYDALGNLLAVSLPDGTLVEYVVDGQNRRVGKKVDGSVVKQWLYRDQLEPVAELDGSGNLVAHFVYATKPNVPDFVLRGGKTYRVLSDHLGSPRYVVNVNDSSEVPFRADYTAFGEVTGTGLDWMPFGFAGGHYDSQTALVRFGARDYDPSVGRWTAKEPLRFAGDRNFFAYAANDPVNHVDLNGLQTLAPPLPWGPLGGVLGGATAGAAVGGIPGALIGALLGAAIMSIPGDTPLPANDNAKPNNDVMPLPYIPDVDDCSAQLELCLEYPQQPEWNCETYGPRKDCGSCFGECQRNGAWPEYKCPIAG